MQFAAILDKQPKPPPIPPGLLQSTAGSRRTKPSVSEREAYPAAPSHPLIVSGGVTNSSKKPVHTPWTPLLPGIPQLRWFNVGSASVLMVVVALFIIILAKNRPSTENVSTVVGWMVISLLLLIGLAAVLLYVHAWPNQPLRSKGRDFLIIGSILIAVGFLWTARHYTMDTSIEAPVSYVFGERIGGRVHNLGLMDERRNGILIGVAITGAGLILVATGSILYHLRP
jgi:hypothetical protein